MKMTPKNHDIWDRRFLNQIIDSMAEGVFTLDREGIITSWNPAMEVITGYSAAEAIGHTCEVMQFNRCFRKTCPTNHLECGIFHHGGAVAKECVMRHKDGHDIPVIKNARLVKDDDGRVIGVVETLTDLTELHKARREAEEATRRLGEMHRLDNIIGKSAAMQDLFAAIKAAASSHATVLIQGESGTGKELVAGAIHYRSAYSDQPFVAVNCSALSETLLESELFGHVRGAFTGAVRDRKGRFEEAHGGTVFLDEIGEVSPYIQVKLLRVLQEREIERVGESIRRQIDIRVIAATNRQLVERVESGAFREDLFYRLKVFPISIPPLRQRREDIPLLVNHFIDIHNDKTGKRIREVDRAAMQALIAHHWPGNVRELENAVEHAFVLCRSETIELPDLPLEIRQPPEPGPTGAPLFSAVNKTALSRGELNRDDLLKLLDDCHYNKAEVARRIGVSRTAVWKYMKKWQIPLQKDE
jgi:PAS domain S-box-containing protein